MNDLLNIDTKKAISKLDGCLEFFKLHHADILRLTGNDDPVTKDLAKITVIALQDLDAGECDQCGHWFPDSQVATIVVHDQPRDAKEDSDTYYHDTLLCKACHENPVG